MEYVSNMGQSVRLQKLAVMKDVPVLQRRGEFAWGMEPLRTDISAAMRDVPSMQGREQSVSCMGHMSSLVHMRGVPIKLSGQDFVKDTRQKCSKVYLKQEYALRISICDILPASRRSFSYFVNVETSKEYYTESSYWLQSVSIPHHILLIGFYLHSGRQSTNCISRLSKSTMVRRTNVEHQTRMMDDDMIPFYELPYYGYKESSFIWTFNISNQ